MLLGGNPSKHNHVRGVAATSRRRIRHCHDNRMVGVAMARCRLLRHGGVACGRKDSPEGRTFSEQAEHPARVSGDAWLINDELEFILVLQELPDIVVAAAVLA